MNAKLNKMNKEEYEQEKIGTRKISKITYTVKTDKRG